MSDRNAPAQTAAPAVARSIGLPTALVDLSRGRQALLSVAQPALGAMLATGGLPAQWRVVLGLAAASSGYVAVFSLNDVLDRHVDEAAIAHTRQADGSFDLDTVAVRHPLARGDVSARISWAWVASLGVVSAVCAYALAPLCLGLFGVAVGLEVLYCSLRSVSWTKTFVSGAMVAVGGLAGWAAVAPLRPTATPVFLFLALWEIAGRNLPNDLADLASDEATGITTVATVFGGRASALWICAGAVATTAAVFALPASPVLRIAWVLIATYTMLLPALRLVRRPVSDQAGMFFNRASLLPALMFAAALAALALGA